MGALASNSVQLTLFSYAETLSVKKAWAKMKTKLWPVMIRQWQVWPAAQAINLFWLPLHYRVLMMNGVGFFWVIYLTWIQHQDHDPASPIPLPASTQDDAPTTAASPATRALPIEDGTGKSL